MGIESPQSVQACGSGKVMRKEKVKFYLSSSLSLRLTVILLFHRYRGYYRHT